MARQRKTLEGGTSDSRQRLVETAARLFRVQGYHATGLNQIVAESKAPKGSLYHYFPDGKEQLGAEALGAAGLQLQAKLQALVQLNPFQALDKLLEMSTQELEASDYRDGCPVATVALETTSTSEILRSTCSAIFSRALEQLQAWLVARGVARNEAESIAVTVFAAFEGALMLCRVQRSSRPLQTVVAQMKVFLKLSLPK